MTYTLSGTIIERAAQLENDEKANQKIKELAFEDLLSKLASVGLSSKANAYNKVNLHKFNSVQNEVANSFSGPKTLRVHSSASKS